MKSILEYFKFANRKPSQEPDGFASVSAIYKYLRGRDYKCRYRDVRKECERLVGEGILESVGSKHHANPQLLYRPVS